jgi:hypothetical protein
VQQSATSGRLHSRPSCCRYGAIVRTALASPCDSFRHGAVAPTLAARSIAPDDTRSSGWTQSSHPLAQERACPTTGIERRRRRAMSGHTTGNRSNMETVGETSYETPKPDHFQAHLVGPAPHLLPKSQTRAGSDRAFRAWRGGRTGTGGTRHRRCDRAGSRRRAEGDRARSAAPRGRGAARNAPGARAEHSAAEQCGTRRSACAASTARDGRNRGARPWTSLEQCGHERTERLLPS